MRMHRTLVAPSLLALAVLAPRGLAQCEEAKLVASDATDGDNFGWAVSLSGDTALVGAYTDGDAGISAGSAYVFDRTGSAWTETIKLIASDATGGEDFGYSVSLDGDTP